MSDGPKPARGFVALIGAPNAGKSTLINRLVGAKVSIVSHKVQTTRSTMRGIAIAGKAQIVFVDTPGIFAPKRRLDRAMVDTAWGGAKDADVVALLIDAAGGLGDEERAILAKLAEVRQPKVLVLNKIDLVQRESAAGARRRGERARALRADLHDLGADRRRARCLHRLARGARCRRGRGSIRRTRSPTCRCARSPPRSRAKSCSSGCIRNCPTSRRSRPRRGRSRRTARCAVEQTIYVARESQKKIVIGEGGATIKAISMAARKEIAELAEQPVHLFLFVKVRENWADDPERYRVMGIEFPKG